MSKIKQKARSGREQLQEAPMRKLSILLCLDGSIYSRYAADLCWRIANSTGAQVTAQHVIDTQSAEEFIVQKPSGFIDAATYKSAYETVHKKLHELALQLQDSYLIESTRHGIRTDFVIDEGDPVLAISARAKGHDLVIIGHKPNADRSKPLYRRQFLRLSVAEALAHECPSPLLVVQGETAIWKEMTVLLSLEHLNRNYVNACMDFAANLDMKTNLICLTTGNCESSEEHIIRDLRQSDPRLNKIAIDIARLEDISMIDGRPIFGHFARADSQRKTFTLPAIPTRAAAGNRVTILDGSPTLFVRFLSLPALLMLPEEHMLDTASVPNFHTGLLNSL